MGIITAIGTGVALLKVGDRVCMPFNVRSRLSLSLSRTQVEVLVSPVGARLDVEGVLTVNKARRLSAPSSTQDSVEELTATYVLPLSTS